MKQMKKYLLAFTLAIVAALPVAAQSEDAAFYIYQNDSHFDGFFYDQVKEIRYSKFDLEGYEHNSYVSQEIVTPDSTYRIMLAAIDSVSFYQPEIIYNPRLRNMDETGMISHLISANGLQLTFDNGLSNDNMPHEGDVLVCYDFNRFEGGFGGKVEKVTPSGSYYIVDCGQLTDFSDIFQQFITVEEYADDGQGNLTPRRVAGMKFPKRVEGAYDGTIFNFSANPHLPWQSGDFVASIDVNAELQTTLKASWNIPVFGKKKFSIELNEEVGVGLGITIDGKLAQLLETKFGNVAPTYIPAAVPVFKVEVLPEGFIRSEVHATLNFQSSKWKKKMSQRISFDDWSFDGDMTFSKIDENEDNSPTATGSINGFIQGGAKFPFVIRTNEFFASILDAKVGFNLYVGPKLSGEINFNLKDAAQTALEQGIDIKRSTFLYDMLKDTKLNFTPLSVDYEMKSHVKAFTGTNEELTLFDGSMAFGTRDWYLLPAFKRVTPSVNYKNVAVTIERDEDRNTLFNTGVGAALYRGDGVFLGTYYPQYGKPEDKTTNINIDLDQGGPYIVRPLISVMGYEFPTSPGAGFESDEPYFYFVAKNPTNPEERIVLTSDDQIHTVDIETNCEVEAQQVGEVEEGYQVTKVNNKVFLIHVPERGGVHTGDNFQQFKVTYKNEQDEPVEDNHTYTFWQKPNYRYSSINNDNSFIRIPITNEDNTYYIINGEELRDMNFTVTESDPDLGITIYATKRTHEDFERPSYNTSGQYEKSTDTEYTISIHISPKGFPWSALVGYETETVPYITSMNITKNSEVNYYRYYEDEETGDIIEEHLDTSFNECNITLGNLCSTPSILSRFDIYEMPSYLGVPTSDIVQSFSARSGYRKGKMGETKSFNLDLDGQAGGSITLNW